MDMKISLKKSERGSVLVVALFTCLVLGVAVCSYVALLESRLKITYRSTAWNSAVPVLEAGIEEAMTHLKDDPNNPTANGWASGSLSGQTVYTKQRTFADGSYFYATIHNYLSNNPTIYSAGFVPPPLANPAYTNEYISRLVRIMATNPPTVKFNKAIAATGPITLSGGAAVDSFNSGNTNYSTNGRYDPAKRQANGNVATDSTANSALVISGNGDIYGQAATGPGGTITMSGNAAIGGLGWNQGIEPGYTNNDMNVAYPSNAAPAGSSSWLAPTSGTYAYNGTNYTYALGNVSNTIAGFTMSGQQSMVVTGNATLYVSGDVAISGQAYIYLAPGASLQLYVAGSSTALSGGGVVNGTGMAASFSYYGLSGNTRVDYSGNSGFIGTIDAPQAAFTVSGTAAMCGAAIVQSFTDSGGAAIHYDQGLGSSGPAGVTITGWVEL